MTRPLYLQEFTRPAFEEYLAEEANPVAIVATGSLEQHGPHLPLGTDSFRSLAIAEELARRTNSFIVHPTGIGYSPHHMGFKGTITLKASTLRAVVLDTIESLVHHGIKKIFVSNIHGGNVQILGETVRAAKDLFPEASTVFGQLTLDPETRAHMQKYIDVHAGEFETGFILLHRPDLVEMERLTNWVPTMKLPPALDEIFRETDDRALAFSLVMSTMPIMTDQLTSSGVYGFADPRKGNVEDAKRRFDYIVDNYVKFIELWKQVPA